MKSRTMKLLTAILLIYLTTLTSCIKTSAKEQGVKPEMHLLHNRKLGASARELLSADVYKSLIIEVQYMKGFKPKEETIQNLRTFMNTYLNKADGIVITLKEIDSVSNKALIRDEIVGIENASRTQLASKGRHAIFILFTNGYHLDKRILGLAYRNTSVVIFGQAIQENSDLDRKLSRSELETAVLLHEMGHLLGLVNFGSSMQSDHADINNTTHCANPKCLMYHSTETKKLSLVLLKGNIPKLDQKCINDLISNGGKNYLPLGFPHH